MSLLMLWLAFSCTSAAVICSYMEGWSSMSERRLFHQIEYKYTSYTLTLLALTTTTETINLRQVGWVMNVTTNHDCWPECLIMSLSIVVCLFYWLESSGFWIPCYLRSTQVPIYWIVRSIWVYSSCFGQVHRSESDPETALSLVRNPHKHKLVGLNQEANLR